MGKENVDLLNSMPSGERLNYAEKLVFGLDGTSIDLSAGMHVIKTESQSGNPKAEFLMYKVNISKGKVAAAINWLRKSYMQGYGDALAMAYYEYSRNNLHGFQEKDLLRSLETAAQMNIPVANYFMGLLAEQANDAQVAKTYFSLADEQGFSERDLDFTCFGEEYRSMSMVDFRGIFQRYCLSDLFENHIDFYYSALKAGTEEQLIHDVWESMIETHNRNPKDYPFTFTLTHGTHTDDKTAYSIIQMPELPNAQGRNLAIYAIVIFHLYNKFPSRFFLGEIGKGFLDKRCIYATEPLYKNKSYVHRNYGPLITYGGKTYPSPIKEEEELNALLEHCLTIYLSDTKGSKGIFARINHKLKYISTIFKKRI